MPPRTRRGVSRGNVAAASSSAATPDIVTPRQESDTAPDQTPVPAPSPVPARIPAPAAPNPSTDPTATTQPPPPPPPPASTSSRSFSLKPKVVRRADDERKALAEQEEKKLSDRIAEDARRRRATLRGRGRGRGRGARGRGDFTGSGRDGLVRRGMADGPLAEGGAVSSSSFSRGATRASGSGGGGGFGHGSSGHGSSGQRGTGDNAFATATSVVEDDERLNTDLFNGRRGSGYDGDDDSNGDGVDGASDADAIKTAPSVGLKSDASGSGHKKRTPQLLPMGIKREEHREPEVVVATTAELEAAGSGGPTAEQQAAGTVALSSSSSTRSEGAVITGAARAAMLDEDNEIWSRALRTHGSVRLVDASGQEVEVTDIDTLAVKRQEIAEAAEAAAATAGVRVKQEDDDDHGATTTQLHAVPHTKDGRGRHSRRQQALNSDDPEEIAVHEGLQAMLHDLAVDDDGHHDDGHHDDGHHVVGGDSATRREGRLFLFQFPSVLPPLQTYAPEEGAQGTEEAAAADGSAVKRELGDDDTTGAASATTPTGHGISASGLLGTLSVRQSGRTELSWGGMTFEMRPGADVQFLTTAVLLQQQQQQKQAEDGTGSHAFGMGPVGGKYNLVPVFRDEEEWVVDEGGNEAVVEEDDA